MVHTQIRHRLYIYLFQWSGYQEEYFGEPGDVLRHRLVHRQQIRVGRSRMLYASGHIENLKYCHFI